MSEFWYCLAHHKNPTSRLDRLSKHVKILFQEYYKIKLSKEYTGVDVEELSDVEHHFFVNINVYRYNGNKAELERHSDKEYKDSLYLNIFTDTNKNVHHFSYISNINNLTKVRLWKFF